MKKRNFIVAISLMLFSTELIAQDSNGDTTDARGTMKPWQKGAWETGKYRNLFLEAGYKQEDIDAKLKALAGTTVLTCPPYLGGK